MPLNQEINRLNTLIDQIPIQGRPVELMGLSGSDKAFLISKIYHQLRFPILVVTPSIKEAQRFLEDLRFFDHSADAALVLFPPYNILPFKFLSYHSETAAQRICALYNIIESKTPPIVVTSVDALLQRVIPKQEIIDYAELIVADEEIERNGFIEKLVAGGYQHASIVEEPGDYCVRGGIVDIYGPLYADPIRIEFFGDTVESIRFFSAASQRTIKPIAEAVVLPAREMVLNKALLLQIINRIRARAAELEIPVTEIRKIIDLIENGQGFPGIESLIPLIYPELDNVFDYLPKNTLIVSSGDGDLARAADESEERIAKNFEASCQGKKLCVDPSQLYLSWPQVEAMISQKKPLAFKQLEVQRGVEPNRSDAMQIRTVVETNADLSLQLTNYQDKENLLKPLADWIDEKRRAGLATFIVCRTKTQAERLKSLLTPYGFQFKLTESFSNAKIEANIL